MRSLPLLVLLALPAAAFAKGSHHAAKKQAAPAPAAPAAPSLVPFSVDCATPGAAIYVDGQQIGVTPLDLPVPVTPGDHSIKIARLGYAPYIDVFSTKGQSEVKLAVELVPVAGVLHVTSNVPGARVLVDGRYVGDAPLDVEADVGARTVQVSKGGYKDYFTNVLTVAGQDQSLAAELEEIPVAPPPPPKWYQKGWVWGTIAAGAAVAAGGAGVGAWAATRDPLASADIRY